MKSRTIGEKVIEKLKNQNLTSLARKKYMKKGDSLLKTISQENIHRLSLIFYNIPHPTNILVVNSILLGLPKPEHP